MLLTIALLLAVIGFSVWHYRQRPRVLQLSVWFNICALAYMVVGTTLAHAMMPSTVQADLDEIRRMCLAAVIGFNVAYLAVNFRSVSTGTQDAGYIPSHTSMLVAVAAGLVCELAAVMLVGPLDFVFSDRVERFTMFQAQQVLFYIGNLANVCLPIVLVRYFRFRERRDFALLILLLVHGMAIGLATISRYDLALVLLIGGYFLEQNRRGSTVWIVCILAASFAATLIYKPVLYDVILGTAYPSDLDLSEYTNWIRHTLMLLASDVAMPHGGYALAFKSLFVISPEQDSLAEWFFKEFYTIRSLLYPDLGYGFSGVWEGYSANGLTGVALHFAAFGAFFGWLERSSTSMRQVIAVFALVLTYRLFRSEAYNFVKTFAWYFLYPTLAIVAADRFLLWATPSRQQQAPQHQTP